MSLDELIQAANQLDEADLDVLLHQVVNMRRVLVMLDEHPPE